MLSVSSSSRAAAGRPDALRARSTTAGTSCSTNCRAETLTDTATGDPARCQRAASTHACSSTHLPRSAMAPVLSAMGMKAPGGMTPIVGWSQRTRASTPTSWRLTVSTRGW